MTTEQNITILINQEPFHLKNLLVTAVEMREKAGAPGEYQVWHIVKSPDPEGQLPLDDIMITDSIEVKSGDRFRVVPPGTFGADVIASQQLAEEVERLQQTGEVKLIPEDNIFHLVLHDYFVPAGYNKTTTRLLLKVPISYPNGKLDMFWVDHDLCLQGGDKQDATTEEVIRGEKWLRFSWHPQKWNPGTDNLRTYLEFVNRRLQQLK
jgi:hypothetical protein